MARARISIDYDVSEYEIAELIEQLGPAERILMLSKLSPNALDELRAELRHARPDPYSLAEMEDLLAAMNRGDLQCVKAWLQREVNERLPRPRLTSATSFPREARCE